MDVPADLMRKTKFSKRLTDLETLNLNVATIADYSVPVDITSLFIFEVIFMFIPTNNMYVLNNEQKKFYEFEGDFENPIYVEVSKMNNDL